MKKRKDGRYQKNIYIGRDENGKRKYKSVCGTSRKEVETLAAELKQKLGKGIDISSDDTYGCWKKTLANGSEVTANTTAIQNA